VTFRRAPFSATLVAVLAVLAGLFVVAPPAQATSTLLCKGFAACTRAGYPNYGYNLQYKKMWWRMYAGHNCTNYVAYRMVSNGMSATRPWSGSGDARNWGVVFASKTNHTPMVGSVAWWSTNHVAYVEQIIDANTIVISEDHYGGDFDWRRIVRSGGGWPTGFIHLNDEKMAATAAPRITGTPKVDAAVTATAGSWNRTGATYSYQWLANGAAIAGATAPTYTPTAEQLSRALSVKVTASKAGYRSASSVSAATAPTAPGTMVVATEPTITGIAKVGGVLTATAASFTPAATTASFSWLADGVPIAGANQPTLTLGPDQLGHRITAVATGQRPGYTDGVAQSAATDPVGPEKLTMSAEPALAGDPHVGRALTVTPGVVGPAGVTVRYRWFRDDVRIKRATGPSYVPTVADLGSRLSLRVRYVKPGYTSIVRTLALPPRVQTYPRIRTLSTSHRTLTVRLRADGVRAVHGAVTLVDARGHHRTRQLKRGTTTFSPRWLRAGRTTVTVVYQGSARVDGRTVTRVLRVE
jgi:surface antigen